MNRNTLIIVVFVLLLVCGFALSMYDSYAYPKDYSLLEEDISECYKPTIDKDDQKILVLMLDESDSRQIQNELVDNKVQNVDVVEFMTVKQNAPQDWNELATVLYKYYPQYDSFIIVHGQQSTVGIKNMAAALSFMLENNKKPIVFASDTNLKNSLFYLYSFNIPEVVILTDIGNRFVRATKPSHVLAKVQDDDEKIVLENRGKNILQSVDEVTDPVKLLYMKPALKVVVLKAFPGLQSSSFDELKKMDAIVVEDLQTLPSEDEVFKALKHLLEEEGIPVINTSPVVEKYFSKFEKASIRGQLIDLGESNTEEDGVNQRDEDLSLIHCTLKDKDIVVVKLLFILSNVQNVNPQLLDKLLQTSLRGE
jgi:L-asparaginase/Glu-tRNA(Gln) amidotransferase subunit D